MEKRRTKYSCKYLQVYLSCQRLIQERKCSVLNAASEKALLKSTVNVTDLLFLDIQS